MIKVIGIGSPFGEDQAGWKVVELLQHALGEKPTPSFACYDRPGIRLLSYLEGCARVYLIDAVQSGETPGTIHCFRNEMLCDIPTNFSTHDMGVLQALQIGSALNMLPDEIILYGIEIDHNNKSKSFSHKVELAVKKLADEIKKELL